MERNQDPRLIEAQDTIETLKRTISILQQEKSTPSITKQPVSISFIVRFE